MYGSCTRCYNRTAAEKTAANAVKRTGTFAMEYDLFLFAGQSNMAGRGITSPQWPQPAPSLTPGAGYEYRAVSDPGHLHPMAEPFGAEENDPNGIFEPGKRLGHWSPLLSMLTMSRPVCRWLACRPVKAGPRLPNGRGSRICSPMHWGGLPKPMPICKKRPCR